MLCPDCGIPMLLVYEPNMGWIWCCSRCSLNSCADSISYDIRLGIVARLAYSQYIDGMYKESQESFLDLVQLRDELEWKMGCYWLALLARYGIEFVRERNGFEIRFWRLDLPDYQPGQSMEWKELYDIIEINGIKTTIKHHMDSIQAAISPLRTLPENKWKVFINWDVLSVDIDTISTLGKSIALHLTTGNPRVECYFPGMNLSTQQNAAASVYYAIKACDIMVAILGNEKNRVDSMFCREIRKFWEKSSKNNGKVFICATTESHVDEILPEWMKEQKLPIRWSYNHHLPMTDFENIVMADIRNIVAESNQSKTKSNQIDVFHESVIKKIQMQDFSWVPQAEVIWEKQRDERFGAILLAYYVTTGNKKAAIDCYIVLRQSDTDLARDVICDRRIQSFVNS